MPPSPRLSAVIDQKTYEKACAELCLSEMPTVKVISGRRTGKAAFGDYNTETNHVRLFLGLDNYIADGLRFAQTELVRTLLHELRHAYQNEHNQALSEADAEEWAIRHVADYRNIIRLSRSYPNSGFSRLSRHDRRRIV